MTNAKVTFTAPVYATEDAEKVKAAVSHLANYGRPKSEEILPDLVSGANPTIVPNKAEDDGLNPFISDAEKIEQTITVSGDLTLLTGIHYLIRKEEIIDTANTALMNGIEEDEDGNNENECRTFVSLNKQAAFMKHLSFPADVEPLGSVYLEIEAETPDDLLKIIDWLTPPTKEGIPVYELKMNEL
ncbi:hypothetical protein LJC08_00700 [Methanimicrococcus sp. OttesenSCG-928-J09]|nr:hypothetical protein [Methanimicrococcus sp. OttesenSCG-928-J09]